MTKHKHAASIIAWANGEEVEYRYPMGGNPINKWSEWMLLGATGPGIWDTTYEFRIKPQDIKVSTRLQVNQKGDHVFGQHPMYAVPNCVCVFDGETRELLRVEIIK